MPYQNLNQCASFNQVVTNSSLAKLSGFSCSEVVIVNPSNATLLVYDNNNSAAASAFAVLSSSTAIIRGVTNSNLISAQFATAPNNGTIYCRAQYYSHSTVSYG